MAPPSRYDGSARPPRLPADDRGDLPDRMPPAADIPLADAHPAMAVPAPQPPRVHEDTVLGVPLAMTDYAQTLDWIDAAIAHDRKGYICVAAVHTVMVCQEDPELRAAVLGAAFVVPDGQPLV